jgi:hypothetical protein
MAVTAQERRFRDAMPIMRDSRHRFIRWRKRSFPDIPYECMVNQMEDTMTTNSSHYNELELSLDELAPEAK